MSNRSGFGANGEEPFAASSRTVIVALFGRKKPDPQPQPGDEGGAGGGSKKTGTGGSGGGTDGFQPQPEKARRWFDHARTAADSTNFEYALSCYANGIRLDPETMSAHEAMLEAAVQYMNRGGKPASSREIRSIEDSHPVSKFAAAEFAWMKELTNASLALKTMEAAEKAAQGEYAHWIAPRVLNLLMRQKKLSKSMLMQAKDLFFAAGAWDQALAVAQKALQIDPSDNDLSHEIQDISAQRAMDQGGYEKAATQEGGFRAFVKDSEKQRELIESETIASNASIDQRNLERGRLAYEKAPTHPEAIAAYAQLLKKEGTPQAEELAHQIYMKGFADTAEYRFRMNAGDIRLDQARRKVELAIQRLEELPGDPTLQAELDEARKAAAELEHTEFNERVARYPTDRYLKVRLGEVEFSRGQFEDAMECFQQAKDEPKLKVRAQHMLGRCFAAESWHSEAIDEYKEAIAAIGPLEKDMELDIRYDLMVSLLAKAKVERSADLAREALDICSGIARKDITYRDIKSRRKEVDQLIRDLSGPASA